MVQQRQTALKGKISNESPVGTALLGTKVGDTVTVETQVRRAAHTRYSRSQRAEVATKRR